ncbi:Transposase IS200 like [Malonomonas rubra DSM 5091]|uniref:Transposase IS200 like n=1 Tax=Malonomonas rubra DSM 5091 TaxID=1122189 RepID=A0A1M6D914_MALRU|nr:Transposase IS200 like [Malonomonas rubra DSM 5091]
MPGVEIETIGYDGDLLYIVMIIPPKYSIFEVMGRLKSQSSFRIREKFEWLFKVYWSDNIVWSSGYFLIDCKSNQYAKHQNPGFTRGI